MSELFLLVLSHGSFGMSSRLPWNGNWEIKNINVS
jgi:hypothetical protein